MMICRWTIWVDATTAEKSLNLLKRIAAELDREPTTIDVARYPKTNGHKVSFVLGLHADSWNDAIVEAIHLGQCAGYEWQLFGSVCDDAEAVSGKSRVAGVQMMQWSLQKNTPDSKTAQP